MPVSYTHLYGMKGFHAENLPVIPDPFVLVPRQVKTENGYKPDAGVLAQIKIIGKLFDSSERIIVATDAGREGELIDVYKRQVLDKYRHSPCGLSRVRLRVCEWRRVGCECA